MEFDLLKKNIQTLNSIDINDKLCIFNEELFINKYSIFRPIYRFFTFQNKEKTHLFIIKLINNLSDELSKFYNIENNRSSLSYDEINIKTDFEYNKLYNEFLKMKESIVYLKLTYKLDRVFVRKLNLSINLIEEKKPNHRAWYSNSIN
tara:strand:+ start:504 stop:947 length:444 start_codon:yes stop_codon:yes gene_type:complete